MISFTTEDAEIAEAKFFLVFSATSVVSAVRFAAWIRD
jgi:hypothetical protein